MEKRMRSRSLVVALCLGLSVFTALPSLAEEHAVTETDTDLGFSVCAKVNKASFPDDISDFTRCGGPAAPPNPCDGNEVKAELGPVPTSWNKMGLVVHLRQPNRVDDNEECELGAGHEGTGTANDLVVTVTKDGQTVSSFTGSSGPNSLVALPLKHGLGPGTYEITVAFIGGTVVQPNGDEVVWLPTSTTGVLEVVTRR